MTLNINLVPKFSTEALVPEEISRSVQESVNTLFQRWAKEESEAEERRWNELFGKSPDVLVRLANEARAERQAGRTRELDPDLL